MSNDTRGMRYVLSLMREVPTHHSRLPLRSGSAAGELLGRADGVAAAVQYRPLL